MARARTWAAAASSRRSGDEQLAGVVDVLVLVVVELVAGDDLARHRGARFGVAEHRHLDLSAVDALLDDEPLVVGRRECHGLVELGRVVHLGYADRRSQVGGLHEQGVAQVGPAHGVGGPVDLGVMHGDPRRLRQPVDRQDLLGLDLVHRQRRRQHPGADVRDSRQLEQALDRSVLAVGAVQQREHHDRQIVGGWRDRAQRLDRRPRGLEPVGRGR